MKRLVYSTVAAVSGLAFASSTQADLIPPEVTDVGDVVYDPSDGSLKLVVNSGSVQASILVTTPQANVVSPAANGTKISTMPKYLGLLDAWEYTYFNSKMQFIDTFLLNGGAPATAGEYLLATLQTGLDASAFGTVEYGSSAGTQFTGVSVIPEPASLALLALGGFAVRRRR